MRINFSLALLALLLSATLWVLVVNDQNPERTDTPDISIPVEINKVPSGLVVMNTVEPVRFKIRAAKDKWTDLRSASFRASVDLSRLSPGIQAVPIIPEVSDSQVHVLEVVPSTVSIRLEEIQERTVPVKVNLSGNVPFGYVYGTAKADPEVVVVSGPASLVQGVESASVDVKLDGISVDIDSAFHPSPVDSGRNPVRNISIEPQTVKVRLPVQQQVSYKQVGVRPSLTGAVAAGYWVESVGAEPSSVTVVGDPKLLAGINYLETAPLSIDALSSGVVQDVKIAVPQGLSLVQQQSVRVRVLVSPLQTSQVVRVAPKIINLDPRLRVTGGPAYIEVVLQGPAPIMQGIRVDTLVVTVDANGLSEGSYSVKPVIVTPPAVSVASVQPETVGLVLASALVSTVTPSPTPTTTIGTGSTGATVRPTTEATPLSTPTVGLSR
jgi:YbbR domain-containing protein